MRRGLGSPRGRQYNYVDMAGVQVGPVHILKEAESLNGNTRWHWTCECGKTGITQGIELKAKLKNLKAGGRCGCSRGCKALRRGL